MLSLGKTGHFYFGWGKEVDIESIPPYWTGWWTTSSLPPEQTSKAWKNEGFFFGRTKNIPQTNEAELRDSFIGAWRLKVNSLASNFNHCSSFLVALLDSSATTPRMPRPNRYRAISSNSTQMESKTPSYRNSIYSPSTTSLSPVYWIVRQVYTQLNVKTTYRWRRRTHHNHPP